VVFLATLLIAAPAIFYWAGGRFDLKLSFICAAAVGTISGAVYDAWRPRQGALHYAAGEWVLAQGGQESQGTLHVVLDLQKYLLVRFTPSGHPPDSSQQLKIKGQWLHLESAYGQDWRALRRALYAAPPSPLAAVPAAAQPNVSGVALSPAGASSSASSVSPT
jgi:hypothetical protein